MACRLEVKTPHPTHLPKPSLLLVALALCILGSLLGQRHSFDPHLSGGLFVGRGVHPPIPPPQPRRASEQPQVILQSWQELLLVRGVTFEYAVACDDASLHLRKPHLAPELALLGRLAPRDDARVLLEEAHQLLRGRDALPA